MDYLGEAGVGRALIWENGQRLSVQGWSWYNGQGSDIDLVGQKKTQSYYRDVVWHRAVITMGQSVQFLQVGFKKNSMG